MIMYEGEDEPNTTARLVRGINILRAMIYFLVVGVQLVHCTTETTSCGVMIRSGALVPWCDG